MATTMMAGSFDGICPATSLCIYSKRYCCGSWSEVQNKEYTWKLRKVCLCREASDMISCWPVLFSAAHH